MQDSLTIYYDERCPLCLAEIHVLAARNRHGLLSFVDINSEQFISAGHPVSCADAMAAMRGRLGNGQMLKGVSVFVEAYRRADLLLLAWLLSRERLRPVFDASYFWFARHRHAISRVIGPPLLRLSRWWVSRRNPDYSGQPKVMRP
jgi:predicted DCC family thiol-disulfide oxidoreductase YuxK